MRQELENIVQNSGILQTKMDHIKLNFVYF